MGPRRHLGTNALRPGDQSLTIDPAKNGGERAEVAMKGVNGRMDIEVRYTLERGVSGFYTYAKFSHGANYPPRARAKAASSWR